MMTTAKRTPSDIARALLEALWPEPMSRIRVQAIPGGLAVPAANFDLIVDLPAARLADAQDMAEHVEQNGRDLLLLNLGCPNSNGMAATILYHNPPDTKSIEAFSDFCFYLNPEGRLALVFAIIPAFPGLTIREPRIVIARKATWASDKEHEAGIAAASLIIDTVLGTPMTRH